MNQIHDLGQKLIEILDSQHRFVLLAHKIDWNKLKEEFKEFYQAETGRPATDCRLILGILILKYMFDLSDEETIDLWLENPYWQYFCGCEYFQKEKPIDPSSMSRWRKKLGSEGVKKLLQESIRLGLKTKVIRQSSLKKIVADTTVQAKNITYPTDSKLYYKSIGKIVKLAKEHSVPLKQTFKKASKQALIKVGRYVHARQMKRAKRECKQLKTFAGRVYRDFKRKASKEILKVKEVKHDFEVISKVLEQKKDSKNKIYSLHEPAVECITKGKAHKKYEFGNKVSIACTAKEGFILSAHACHGNPYDGHTLKRTIRKVESNTKQKVEVVLLDQGYKGHKVSREGLKTLISKNIKKLSKQDRKLLKRRQVVEPIIGHIKNNHRMRVNYLKDKIGDALNSVFSSIGYNMRRILAAVKKDSLLLKPLIP